MNPDNKNYDVLIIGTGAAGLTMALKVADNKKVALISKGDLSAGSTRWAQGGIAAVLTATDTTESHVEDTLIAGAGLCDPKAVQYVVENGRTAIENLIGYGVPFSKDPQPVEEGFGFHLTREGGHSHRRIIHVDDATGRAVQKTLEERVSENSNIDIFENHMAIDLVTNKHLTNTDDDDNKCYGAYVLNNNTGRVTVIKAGATVLATGGASKVYLYTSNPDGSTGDGIAMGWRAGCRVANMEFNQFHPTCLYHPEAKSFLVTEALRGEGAKLIGPNGKQFMKKYDKRGELAPRDIVARAIDNEMKRLGLECVYLDISHKDPDFIISHFPTIYRRCKDYGFDITTDRIPVVPAAHYTCGGIMTDLNGQTDLGGLFAIGEAAHTGLHGANRMASNSLLECLVFGEAAAKKLLQQNQILTNLPEVRDWDESRVTDSDELVVVTHNWEEVRHFMWDYVGIVRTDKRLERAQRRLDMLKDEIKDYYGNFRVNGDLLELRNLVTVADLIVKCAKQRKESRGLHFTTDYPKMKKKAVETILVP